MADKTRTARDIYTLKFYKPQSYTLIGQISFDVHETRLLEADKQAQTIALSIFGYVQKQDATSKQALVKHMSREAPARIKAEFLSVPMPRDFWASMDLKADEPICIETRRIGIPSPIPQATHFTETVWLNTPTLLRMAS